MVRGPSGFSSEEPHIRPHHEGCGFCCATACFGSLLLGVNTPTVLCQAPAVAVSTCRVPFFTVCHGDG